MITEITSRQNDHIKYCRKILSSTAFRKKEKVFLVEGKRLSLELLKQDNIKILKCFITKSIYETLQEPLLSVYNKAQNRFLCDNFVLESISDTKSPQGIICLCGQSKIIFETTVIKQNKKYLVLEGITDPGNLGTIIRTAEGLGIDGLIITGSGVDLYNPKVVRSSMGSMFRLPILEHESGNEVANILEKSGVTTYAAVLSEDAELLSEVKFSPSSAVFIGNEAEGLKKETYTACNKRIIINMKSNTESLNAAVASSILMWEMIK